MSLYAKDWQDKDIVVVFSDPLFMEDYGLVGEELSHLDTLPESDAKQTACLRTEEDPANYSSMLIYGAWSDEPLFHVVASRVAIHSSRPR